MQVIRLGSETDFQGWRTAARRLRAQGVAPGEVIWTVDGAGAAGCAASDGDADRAITVPRAFVDLAAQAILHRSDERFSLLYSLLWRLGREPGLLQARDDAEAAKARAFAQAVERATFKMKAFAGFQRIDDAQGGPTYVAWFEPAHRVTERAAPFFTGRYPRFSLLTPDVCAHWDGRRMKFTPGADPADAPGAGTLADYWRSRCAADLGRNLAPAPAIPEPTQSVEAAAVMAARPPIEPDRRTLHAVQRASRDTPYDGTPPARLEEVELGVQACRRCDLYRCATQGVAGEGPARPRLMLVGEQPGDQEDLAGRPFVGPAGQVLDRALAAAGAARDRIYVTNAVKHFKHELRGKRRLHKTPDAGEVQACRWWLDAERRILRPRVIVALGATAALAVFGKPTPIGKSRGQALQLPDQAQGVVTYHPSYLLRVPDAAAKAEAFEAFVADLKMAWRLAA